MPARKSPPFKPASDLKPTPETKNRERQIRSSSIDKLERTVHRKSQLQLPCHKLKAEHLRPPVPPSAREPTIESLQSQIQSVKAMNSYNIRADEIRMAEHSTFIRAHQINLRSFGPTIQEEAKTRRLCAHVIWLCFSNHTQEADVKIPGGIRGKINE